MAGFVVSSLSQAGPRREPVAFEGCRARFVDVRDDVQVEKFEPSLRNSEVCLPHRPRRGMVAVGAWDAKRTYPTASDLSGSTWLPLTTSPTQARHTYLCHL
jgi:hypothetical protein